MHCKAELTSLQSAFKIDVGVYIQSAQSKLGNQYIGRTPFKGQGHLMNAKEQRHSLEIEQGSVVSLDGLCGCFREMEPH